MLESAPDELVALVGGEVFDFVVEAGEERVVEGVDAGRKGLVLEVGGTVAPAGSGVGGVGGEVGGAAIAGTVGPVALFGDDVAGEQIA